MKDAKAKLKISSIRKLGLKIKPYLWLALLVLFAGLYGYLFFKINSFSNAKPSDAQVSSDLKTTALPAINQNVVNQLNNLKDNSVSVQALFNQARSNPFQ